jgi:hypothetical protein
LIGQIDHDESIVVDHEWVVKVIVIAIDMEMEIEIVLDVE